DPPDRLIPGAARRFPGIIVPMAGDPQRRRTGRAVRFARLLLGLAALAPARGLAEPHGAKKPAPAATRSGPEVKTYEFSGRDVEGKLRTPQLLYFLHRMEAEFDATAPAKRSFLPELKRSTDGM